MLSEGSVISIFHQLFGVSSANVTVQQYNGMMPGCKVAIKSIDAKLVVPPNYLLFKRIILFKSKRFQISSSFAPVENCYLQIQVKKFFPEYFNTDQSQRSGKEN